MSSYFDNQYDGQDDDDKFNGPESDDDSDSSSSSGSNEDIDEDLDEDLDVDPDEDLDEEEDEDCWINWFCNIEENELFCAIDKSYITDHFNLYGLKNIIGKDYNQAMNIIVDKPGR